MNVENSTSEHRDIDQQTARPKTAIKSIHCLTLVIAFVLIINGFGQATLQLSAINYTVAENAGAATLTVQRKADTNTEVGVDCATADGTATGTLIQAVHHALGPFVFNDGLEVVRDGARPTDQHTIAQPPGSFHFIDSAFKVL